MLRSPELGKPLRSHEECAARPKQEDDGRGGEGCRIDHQPPDGQRRGLLINSEMTSKYGISLVRSGGTL